MRRARSGGSSHTFRTTTASGLWLNKTPGARGPDPAAEFCSILARTFFDEALVLFGAPLAISAEVSSEREGSEVDDAFDVRFEYPEMHAYLRASMMACAPGPRFVLHGTKGSFVKCGMDPQEAYLRRGEPPAGPHWGEEPEADWGSLWFPNGDSRTEQKVRTEAGDYRLFYANVRDAILEGKPQIVPAREGLRSVRAIELVQQSSRERRTIPWSDFTA